MIYIYIYDMVEGWCAQKETLSNSRVKGFGCGEYYRGLIN